MPSRFLHRRGSSAPRSWEGVALASGLGRTATCHEWCRRRSQLDADVAHNLSIVRLYIFIRLIVGTGDVLGFISTKLVFYMQTYLCKCTTLVLVYTSPSPKRSLSAWFSPTIKGLRLLTRASPRGLEQRNVSFPDGLQRNALRLGLSEVHPAATQDHAHGPGWIALCFRVLGFAVLIQYPGGGVISACMKPN